MALSSYPTPTMCNLHARQIRTLGTSERIQFAARESARDCARSNDARRASLRTAPVSDRLELQEGRARAAGVSRSSTSHSADQWRLTAVGPRRLATRTSPSAHPSAHRPRLSLIIGGCTAGLAPPTDPQERRHTEQPQGTWPRRCCAATTLLVAVVVIAIAVVGVAWGGLVVADTLTVGITCFDIGTATTAH